MSKKFYFFVDLCAAYLTLYRYQYEISPVEIFIVAVICQSGNEI